jgi:prevent-host-death family protein
MAVVVGIAELKAKLSHYLRLVREGQEVIIKDRDTPIARLSPHGRSERKKLTIYPARRPLSDLDNIRRATGPVLPPKQFQDLLDWMKHDRFEDWFK